MPRLGGHPSRPTLPPRYTGVRAKPSAPCFPSFILGRRCASEAPGSITGRASGLDRSLEDGPPGHAFDDTRSLSRPTQILSASYSLSLRAYRNRLNRESCRAGRAPSRRQILAGEGFGFHLRRQRRQHETTSVDVFSVLDGSRVQVQLLFADICRFKETNSIAPNK